MKEIKAIEVKNLKKSFGELKVLKDINFTVQEGQILAMLGPNGAGKTTTINILSTLLQPDSGKVQIAGHDVQKSADQVRAKIGLTGQFAAVDEYLTGRENIKMIGLLYHLNPKTINERVSKLLKQFDLEDAADRPAKTYSGGMKRRLDLAVSLIATPPVIFLDEPTTGLDPRSRLAMWNIIKKLMEDGTTILLTTQYLEEADQLADRIVVIDNGKVIAEGTAKELKSKLGNDRLELTFNDLDTLEKAHKLLGKSVLESDDKEYTLVTAIKDTNKDVKKVLDALTTAKISVASLAVHRPTMDDVFLSLTGKQKTAKKPARKGKK